MQPHISVEDLEHYYLGMMPKRPARAAVEEHLLVCRNCLRQARHVKSYTGAIGAAILNRKQDREPRASGSQSRRRLTLQAVNNELAKRGHTARLAKASDYFYFHLGEAADWLERAVRVPTLSSLTLKQWLAEFDRLRKVNAELFKLRAAKPGKVRAQSKKQKK